MFMSLFNRCLEAIRRDSRPFGIFHEREARREAAVRSLLICRRRCFSISLATLKSGIKITKQAEDYLSAIEGDHRVQELFTFSGAELKARVCDIKKTLAYANSLANLAVPPVLIEWLFASSET